MLTSISTKQKIFREWYGFFLSKVKYPFLWFAVITLLSSWGVGVICGIYGQRQHWPRELAFQASDFFSEIPSIKRASSLGEEVYWLETRKFSHSVDETKYDTEMDSSYVYQKYPLNLQKTALVLMDVWETHANDGWMERSKKNIQDDIVPLLQLARMHRIPVIHISSGRKIANSVAPIKGEIIFDGDYLSAGRFDDFLKRNGIKTLIYAGYASNMCLISRPSGIIKMSLAGYDIILMRDCTIAFETPETLAGEWANKVIINTIEHQWGVTSSLTDLKETLSPNS